MKRFLLFGGLIALLGFVACKDDEDDPIIPTPLPTFPSGQYKVAKIEFRDSTNQLVQTFTQPNDSTQYLYYNALGQFAKAVRVKPTECIDNWTDFTNSLGFATYDSTQFFPPLNIIKLHFYVGWQSAGFGDEEYLFYYLTKSSYLQADTVSCN